MSSTIQVEAARIPDRDRLLEVLREHGLDARAQNDVGIEVPCADGGDELFGYVESVIMDVGAHFVPMKHDDVIYIRPPIA